MSCGPRTTTRRGLTVVETLIALAVLTVASTGFMLAVGSTATVQQMTRSERRVRRAMDDVLETLQGSGPLLSADAADLAALIDEAALHGIDPVDTATPILAIDVDRVHDHTSDPPAAVDGLVVITLTARWRDGDLPFRRRSVFYHYDRQ